MKITHEIRQYIIEDGDIRYAIRHAPISDDWFYSIIEDIEPGTHVNSTSWFDASDELKEKFKQTIKQYNYDTR